MPGRTEGGERWGKGKTYDKQEHLETVQAVLLPSLDLLANYHAHEQTSAVNHVSSVVLVGEKRADDGQIAAERIRRRRVRLLT